MNKRFKYLAAGVIAAIIAVSAAACFAAGSRKKEAIPPDPDTSAHGGVTEQTDNMTNNREITDNNTTEDEASADDNINRYLLRQDEIMKDMIHKMKSIPKTGNASIDFLNGMTPYYEAAIELSGGYLEYNGDDETLKELAGRIKTTQPGEIRRLQELIRKYEAENHNGEEQENACLDDYDKMLDREYFMKKSGTDSLEHAFAERLMIHHQMAVEMAKSILKYTDCGEIRTLAQDLIDSQEKEMEDIKNYIS